MTTLTLNHHPMVLATVNRLANFVSLAWFDLIAKRVRYELDVRSAIATLKVLDDRNLDDIGISRSEIVAVVRGRTF